MKVLLIALLALLPAVLATPIATSAVNGFTFTSVEATPAVILRFQGMTSNLAVNTDYTLSNVDSAYTVSNLKSGRYTFSDDNGVTWRNVSTDCLTPDVPPITLDTTNSATTAASGRLRLKLRFLENRRYYSITYKYQGAVDNCNSTKTPVTDATTYQAWTRSSTDSGAATCGGQKTEYEQDFNTALTICNYYRDETDADLTVFNATIIITTVDTGVVIRGYKYERTLETAVVIKIRFQTNVSAVANNPSIFGSRITYGAVTRQDWNTATFTSTLTLVTSVQWPYQLYLTSFTSVINDMSSWATHTTAATPQDGSNDITGVARDQRSSCFQQDLSTAQTYGDNCWQKWTITLARSTSCTGSNELNLSGSWRIDYGVTCPSLFNGSCNTPVSNADYITFFTNSTNYCPVIIDNNNLNTATLTTYQNSAYSQPQNQFVFGTTTYFEATITSPIMMSDVAVEYVYLTAGGTVSATTPYFSRPFTSAATYFGASATAGTFGTASACGNGETFATQGGMTVSDNAGTAGTSNAFTKYVRFTLLWNPCTSAATGDLPQATTVQVNIRIRYQDQNAPAAPAAKVIALSKTIEFATETGVASTTVGITQGSVSTAGASSASGSSAMTVVGVVAGVVGVTALLVGMTVYMLRRNRAGKADQQVASVQLQSSP